MKVSIGIAMFILTIIFATIAMENNKIAREIVVRNFGLMQQEQKPAEIKQQVNQAVTASVAENTQVKAEEQAQKPQQETNAGTTYHNDKWADFDRKFENFDENFKGMK